jgi:hypothetical protein
MIGARLFRPPELEILGPILNPGVYLVQDAKPLPIEAVFLAGQRSQGGGA